MKCIFLYEFISWSQWGYYNKRKRTSRSICSLLFYHVMGLLRLNCMNISTAHLFSAWYFVMWYRGPLKAWILMKWVEERIPQHCATRDSNVKSSDDYISPHPLVSGDASVKSILKTTLTQSGRNLLRSGLTEEAAAAKRQVSSTDDPSFCSFIVSTTGFV